MQQKLTGSNLQKKHKPNELFFKEKKHSEKRD